LKETNQKNMKELNNLKMDKGTLLQKIIDLEDKLMEMQLQLEKFLDNKLAKMLIKQKCSSDKAGLGYVPTTDASNCFYFKNYVCEALSSRLSKCLWRQR